MRNSNERRKGKVEICKSKYQLVYKKRIIQEEWKWADVNGRERVRNVDVDRRISTILSNNCILKMEEEGTLTWSNQNFD